MIPYLLLSVQRIAVLLVFCLIWYLLVQYGYLNALFVSSPDAVVKFLLQNFTDEIFSNAIETLMATLIAFTLSAVLGIAFGLFLYEFPWVKKILDPFLTAMNSLPRIALAPIFILWFGIGLPSKIALAFSLGFFIVLNSTIAGIKNVDLTLLRLSKSLGCTPWQQFRKIMLPWAVPSIFAGFKLALIYSFLGVVTSEMIASKMGLGQLIMYYSGLLRMDAVLGILVVLAVCAVCITYLADKIEAALIGNWIDTENNKK